MIESVSSLFDTLKESGGAAPVVEVSGAGSSCGCLLSELVEGDAERVYLDRFKLRWLGLKDGDEVVVSPASSADATDVVLRVPRDYLPADTARLVGKPLIAGETTALFSFSGEPRIFEVWSTAPEGLVVVGPRTQIKIATGEPDGCEISYSDIGGLQSEIRRIREVAELPFRMPELFEHLGVTPPKGIILHGPPGTGKTLIARALAAETGARFYSISGPEVYSKWYGKTEEKLRNIFTEAIKNAPAIVVVDELDALVPRREKTHGDQEQRIVATFLTQMDGLRQLKDVVVLGTTNRLDAIDPALRRGGRFECEIHIGVPDAAGRAEILKIHSRGMPLEAGVDLDALAAKMNGYVGADIASVCREAAYNSVRRSISLDSSGFGDEPPVGDLSVSHADFEKALGSVSPSGGREFQVELAPVEWDDVGGLEPIKRLLVENVGCAVERREAYLEIGIRPASGILLHGPPGTGKTLLARAVASECGVNFIALKGSTLRSRWLGEVEERIRLLFARARQLAPCVIFFDEMDAAVPGRGRSTGSDVDSIVNQVLVEMDGISSGDGVHVIGATNRIELLDPAVLRPGRFDHLVEVPLPDMAGRREIFDVHLRSKPLAEDVARDRLSEETAGFSGAEIAEVCRDAGWISLRDAGFDPAVVCVTMAALTGAIARVRGLRAHRRVG